MKVQCLLPKYNNRKYFKNAIQSLIDQKEKFDSILISENHSTDGSSDFAEEIASQNNNIKWFMPKLPAPTWGSNCSELIVRRDETADYFHFASADDIWHDNFLQTFKSFINSNDNISAVFCDRIYIDSLGKNLGASGNTSLPTILSQEEALAYFLRGLKYNISGALFRSDVVENAIEFASSVGQSFDWPIMIEASRLGNIGYICKPLYQYRLHELSTYATVTYSLAADIKEFLVSRNLYDTFMSIHASNEKLFDNNKSMMVKSTIEKLIDVTLPRLKLVGHSVGLFGLVRSAKGLNR